MKIIFGTRIVVIGTIYSRQEHTVSVFLEDLESGIIYANSTNKDVVIGDFNINVHTASLLSSLCYR